MAAIFRPGDKPLSEPMMISLPTHICVTRPQWFNYHYKIRYESGGWAFNFLLEWDIFWLQVFDCAEKRPFVRRKLMLLSVHSYSWNVNFTNKYMYIYTSRVSIAKYRVGNVWSPSGWKFQIPLRVRYFLSHIFRLFLSNIHSSRKTNAAARAQLTFPTTWASAPKYALGSRSSDGYSMRIWRMEGEIPLRRQHFCLKKFNCFSMTSIFRRKQMLIPMHSELFKYHFYEQTCSYMRCHHWLKSRLWDQVM